MSKLPHLGGDRRKPGELGEVALVLRAPVRRRMTSSHRAGVGARPGRDGCPEKLKARRCPT